MALESLQNLRVLMGEDEFTKVQGEGVQAMRLNNVSSAELTSAGRDSGTHQNMVTASSSKFFTSQWPVWDEPAAHNGSSSDDSYQARAPVPETRRKAAKGRNKTSPGNVSEHDTAHGEVGELPPLEMTFCPILAVSKFPYKFMSTSSAFMSEEVSRHFFAADKFWMRQWTIYYIHLPPSISVKPFLLVPADEVRALLQEINATLDLGLDFPIRAEERGFHLNFPEDGNPRPRFLGTSSSREHFNTMESKVPRQDFMLKENTTLADEADDRSYNAFKLKMENAFLATRNRTKASKEKKKLQRVQQKDGWCRQLKRAQRYLGLQPRRPEAAKSDWISRSGTSWEDYLRAKEEHERALESFQPTLHIDVDKSVPYPFDENILFICVDVESFERNHNQITEVGISTLDTYDLVGIAPGKGGKAWLPKIRARHFRIQEHAHLVNKDFIQGCADRFEKDFGKSEFVSIKEAPQVVASCFRPPFSRPANENTTTLGKEEKRNIILVGHDTKTDINYLRQIGYDVANLSNLVETLDTTELYRALKHDSQSSGLGSLLVDLGLTGWNLHNAGNDAAYTMQALIGIAFRALTAREDRDAMDQEKRKAAAMQEAATRIAEDNEEWDAAEGNGDGGSPEKNLEAATSQHGGSSAPQRRGRGGGRGGERAGFGRGRGAGRGGGAVDAWDQQPRRRVLPGHLRAD